MYLFVGGTMDAYQRVEGALDAAPQSDCYVRFLSSRTGEAHGQQRVAPGPFKIGFVYSLNDKRSDFSAQLSCNGGDWRTIAAPSAFVRNLGTALNLGTISP